MTYRELQKLDRAEIEFQNLMVNMIRYKETIDKVTMVRKTNAQGRYFAHIVVYLCNTSGNIHPLCIKLYDEQYVWFVCALQEEFPETPFFDLTEEKYKLVKQNDLQTSTEAVI